MHNEVRRQKPAARQQLFADMSAATPSLLPSPSAATRPPMRSVADPTPVADEEDKCQPQTIGRKRVRDSVPDAPKTEDVAPTPSDDAAPVESESSGSRKRKRQRTRSGLRSVAAVAATATATASASASASATLRRDHNDDDNDSGDPKLETDETPSLPLSRRYVTHRTQAATLSDGLYVGVSDLVPSKPMLGLFADRDFSKGSVVTEYGGRARIASEVRMDIHSRSHMMAARGAGVPMVYDGKEFSRQFSLDWKELGPNATPEQRKGLRVLPTGDGTLNDPILRAKLLIHIMSSGAGYMANSPHKGDRPNVHLRMIKHDTAGLGPQAIFYIASRDINRGEEILVDYKWTDPLMLAMIGRA